METTVSIVGGVGLFLLGMAVMADGLKALAGTALKTVLEKAAATPLIGAFWGAIITLLVQSSSATTMTTIGLVSAGLLTFPQGLSLVFGANIGATGAGWLVAAFGVAFRPSRQSIPADGDRGRGRPPAFVYVRAADAPRVRDQGDPAFIWPWLILGGLVFFVVEIEKAIIRATGLANPKAEAAPA